jgi:hypothetical protein
VACCTPGLAHPQGRNGRRIPGISGRLKLWSDLLPLITLVEYSTVICINHICARGRPLRISTKKAIQIMKINWEPPAIDHPPEIDCAATNFAMIALPRNARDDQPNYSPGPLATLRSFSGAVTITLYHHLFSQAGGSRESDN